jgi:phosphoglycerate dehydrogenase-like enzyme
VTTRICFLDDYQGVATTLAPLDRLEDTEWTSIADHLTGDDLVAAVAGHDVIVAMRERTRFDRELFDRLEDLRLLCTTGPANAAIDLQAAADHGVTVSATDGRASGNTAELAWGLVLAVFRHLATEVDNVRAGRWQTTVGTDLAGATLGLLGLGRIGQRMARVANAFGMEVVAWSQNLTAEAAEEAGARLVGREELFATADVLSIHLILSDRSRGLVGEAELRSMKPTGVLINTSRGPIVDEDALVRVLADGAIAGAGVDVYGTEPLPADHPLRTMANVVATPHIGYVTRGALESWYVDVIEDVAAWQAGEPIRVLGP